MTDRSGKHIICIWRRRVLESRSDLEGCILELKPAAIGGVEERVGERERERGGGFISGSVVIRCLD